MPIARAHRSADDTMASAGGVSPAWDTECDRPDVPRMMFGMSTRGERSPALRIPIVAPDRCLQDRTDDEGRRRTLERMRVGGLRAGERRVDVGLQASRHRRLFARAEPRTGVVVDVFRKRVGRRSYVSDVASNFASRTMCKGLPSASSIMNQVTPCCVPASSHTAIGVLATVTRSTWMSRAFNHRTSRLGEIHFVGRDVRAAARLVVRRATNAASRHVEVCDRLSLRGVAP